jgi:hypothetical protein
METCRATPSSTPLGGERGTGLPESVIAEAIKAEALVAATAAVRAAMREQQTALKNAGIDAVWTERGFKVGKPKAYFVAAKHVWSLLTTDPDLSSITSRKTLKAEIVRKLRVFYGVQFDPDWWDAGLSKKIRQDAAQMFGARRKLYSLNRLVTVKLEGKRRKPTAAAVRLIDGRTLEFVGPAEAYLDGVQTSYTAQFSNARAKTRRIRVVVPLEVRRDGEQPRIVVNGLVQGMTPQEVASLVQEWHEGR